MLDLLLPVLPHLALQFLKATAMSESTASILTESEVTTSSTTSLETSEYEDLQFTDEKRIQFHIAGATGLQPVGKHQRPPSAYVKIHISGVPRKCSTFQTAAVLRQQNPTWHENVPAVDIYASSVISFELVHQSRWPKRHVTIGSATASLHDLLRRQGSFDRDRSVTLDLDYAPGLCKTNSKLTISVRELSTTKTAAEALALATKARASLQIEHPIPLAVDLRQVESVKPIDKLTTRPLSQVRFIPLQIH
ncbi:hypothetical protein HGRIS_001918 [Hohenbuehelia grisea]|uniref:C2 domain-containing protein n=1 Tax=Hohenbuehelia grisea TaxID=104357 RepID=A0ABR3JIZ9_9AGAR